MEPEQRALLRKWRVELVETINIQDGLFTQLLSRNVLTSRTVSRIKKNRPPEEQVEELLDEVQKKDCFDTFCDSLDADGQEHIVNKYLKQTKKQHVEVSDSIASSASTSSTAAPAKTSENITISSENTDSVDRTYQSRNPSIVIRESDNKHVYIRYNDDDASPNKRSRGMEADKSLILYEQGEARYALKHYVSDPADLFEKSVISHKSPRKGPIPDLIMENPQSILFNSNISDPTRYMAAFKQQSSDVYHSANMRLENEACHSILSAASVPMTDHPSKKNEQDSISEQDIRKLLRPNITNTQAGLLNQMNAHNRGQFVNLSQGLSTNNLKVSHYTSPQQYLGQAEAMTPSKLPSSIMSTSPPVRDPGFMDQFGSSRSDSVDTMAVKDTFAATKLGWSHLGNNNGISVEEDSLKGPVKFTTVPGETIDFGSTLKAASCLFPSHRELSPLKIASPDMDDIDLPDGCVNVKVEHCTEEFFHSNHKKSYPMRRLPRGYALILNVNEVVGKAARMGTNYDRDNLCNLLTQLHFNIIVHNDKDGLSAQEMVMKLRSFAKLEVHSQSDACFICLLSHGEEEYIFGTDGKRIPLNEIFMLFDNNNCKGLIGKPKVFIIQACRGGSLDKGVLMDEPDGGSLPARSSNQLPSMSDMLICYPTLHGYFLLDTGYFAWRNRARGSWYIEAIVQIFMRYAKNEDVCAMLNRVNHLVSRKVSESSMKEMNQMSQMSEYKSTLRFAHLYLFPGIAIRNSAQPGLQNSVFNRRI